jgi:hypothetical protein
MNADKIFTLMGFFFAALVGLALNQTVYPAALFMALVSLGMFMRAAVIRGKG